MSVTIKQVAREAGVSIATVSRVLNDKGPVLAQTRRRILKVAARLRYVPHGGARSLITRTTSTIGVLLPDIYGEFFSELIRGLDRASRRRGFHLLVSSSHGDRAEFEEVLRATRGRVDGLIVMTPDVDAKALRDNLPEGLPLVALSSPVGLGPFDTIAIDNRGGAEAMVRHLAALGHRRIAFVKGPPGNHDARERLAGYRAALASLRLRRSTDLEHEGDFTEEAGHAAGRRILAGRHVPDAIFCANDTMAIGVLSALREAGANVPGDVALGGFDDVPLARFTAPPLTTVRVPILEMGIRAMERLFAAIDGTPPAKRRRHETLETALVVRESCGTPAYVPVHGPGTSRLARRAKGRR